MNTLFGRIAQGGLGNGHMGGLSGRGDGRHGLDDVVQDARRRWPQQRLA